MNFCILTFVWQLEMPALTDPCPGRLLGHLDSQINRVGKILHPDTPLPHGTFCAVTELKLWETLLESREKESLLSNIRSFLYSKAPLLTLENMQEIRQDIVQIIYSFFKTQ